jgi:hypothetical protein
MHPRPAVPGASQKARPVALREGAGLYFEGYAKGAERPEA